MSTTPLSEDQRKSLELIQGIVGRLSTHGFLLKGWAVTLVTALQTFSGSAGPARVAALALLPALIFWVLDAYLLAQEHGYRHLFDQTRLGRRDAFDFELPRLTARQWIGAAVRRVHLMFYLPLLAVVLVILGRFL